MMGDKNEEISLTNVVMDQPTIPNQNELIMQLMQQIAEERIEMQMRHDLSNPVFTVNASTDGRPPLSFPLQTWNNIRTLFPFLLKTPQLST